LIEHLELGPSNRNTSNNSMPSAVEAAARAKPDGYTIVFASAGALVIVPHMQSTLRYDPLKDLAPICRVVGTPMVLVVGKHVRANTAKDFQELAKANPGKLSFGSTGSGSSVHLAAELFKIRAGIDLFHVPYRGGAPAVTAATHRRETVRRSAHIPCLYADFAVVQQHVNFPLQHDRVIDAPGPLGVGMMGSSPGSQRFKFPRCEKN
jgi:hypothetical protein